MKAFTATFVAVTWIATAVYAHGYVQSLEIGGRLYEGYLPDTDNLVTPLADTKITRHIPSNGPVLDWTSQDIMCNVGAQDAEWRTNQTAAVEAGTDMSFTWNAVSSQIASLSLRLCVDWHAFNLGVLAAVGDKSHRADHHLHGQLPGQLHQLQCRW